MNYVRGMGSRHELEVRLDGVLLRSFSIGGEEPDVLQATVATSSAIRSGKSTCFLPTPICG